MLRSYVQPKSVMGSGKVDPTNQLNKIKIE